MCRSLANGGRRCPGRPGREPERDDAREPAPPADQLSRWAAAQRARAAQGDLSPDRVTVPDQAGDQRP